MTKIDIFSGFLGAGKTTLIKKLLREAYAGERVVLIENEFGEIGIDGGFLREAGIEITEMNSGCICCSLVGDFTKSLSEVLSRFSPDRILIEPSGVGKLSDVRRAVEGVEGVEVSGTVTVVDVNKCRMYMKNFGEFFGDQIANAGTVIFSHTDRTTPAKLAAALDLVREANPHATVITTPWDELDGRLILETVERRNTLEAELAALREHEHHHHHHEHGEDCTCGCHGHHEHEHHDHEHDHEYDHEHEHHHHHEHGEDCTCGCHGHHGHEHGHHHHHADDVFDSFGVETARRFTREEVSAALAAFARGEEYGTVLRAKGILPSVEGEWIHFDYVPGEPDIRLGGAEVIGRLCVIGTGLDRAGITRLFGLSEE